MRANATVSVLKLRDCNIDAEGTLKLAEVLRLVNDLTTVDLSFNAFDINGIKILGREWSSLLSTIPRGLNDIIASLVGVQVLNINDFVVTWSTLSIHC